MPHVEPLFDLLSQEYEERRVELFSRTSRKEGTEKKKTRSCETFCIHHNIHYQKSLNNQQLSLKF